MVLNIRCCWWIEIIEGKLFGVENRLDCIGGVIVRLVEMLLLIKVSLVVVNLM